jgi:K+-transporting ATPase ATPase C chain
MYPLVVFGFAQGVFHDKANGSLVKSNGQVVGSSLIGQNFTQPQYFHPRPSSAGQNGYDPMGPSSGSNLGPSNPALITDVQQRVAAYRQENGLAPDAQVPVDAVTASGSGLDPHISVANARLQANRVAAARSLPLDQVMQLIDANTDGRDLGFMGEPGVNVLELNLALDKLGP